MSAEHSIAPSEPGGEPQGPQQAGETGSNVSSVHFDDSGIVRRG